jgi:putative spermidine/putrescine transport system ATP-binding protein
MDRSGDRQDVDVRLQNMVIHYGETQVVHGINLDIYKGEFLSLLGPSGCGKTTTLNAIAGFLDPSSGTISLRGNVVNNVPPHRRSLGMVFQSYALFPHMTVFDNVAFGLSIRRRKSSEIRSKVMEALELVQLQGFEDRRIRQLSGGQQQRIAIARALAFNPLVLLMDEPLSNLDAQLRRQMRVELRRIQRQVGITTIFVTHDQEEALTMSDRMVLMNAGNIEQIGTPVDLYRKPKTPFVAQFLGHPNFLYGDIVEVSDGKITMKTGEHIVVAETEDQFKVGQRVALVLRAESIRLQRETPNPVRNAIPARIEYLVYLGTNAEYEVTLEGGVNIRVVEQIANGIPSFQVGEPVYVTWSSEDSIVLPAPAEGFMEGVG